ncbi:MAG: hypothetical protein J4451_02210 [DPANN group archaeon]|nr:hypothetical protein [DPANN group archaeon]
MAKNLLENKTTQLAVVIAVGLLALSFVGTQTGFAPYAPATNCVDDDGGDISTLGICTDSDEVSGDFCVSNTELVEHQCYYNTCVQTTQSCALGNVCVNGRCVNPNALA